MQVNKREVAYKGSKLTFCFADNCCGCVDESPAEHLQNLIKNSRFLSHANIRCLTQATLAVGDQLSLDYLRERLLKIGPPKRDLPEPEQGGGEGKKRITEEAERISRLLSTLSSLKSLSRAVPAVAASQDDDGPSVQDFFDLLLLYAKRFIAFDNNEFYQRNNKSILFVRAHGSTKVSDEIYLCDYFMPLLAPTAEDDKNLAFYYYKGDVNIRTGEIVRIGEREYAEPITATEVIRGISESLRTEHSVEIVGVFFTIENAPAAAALSPAAASAAATKLPANYSAHSLQRIGLAAHFADSHDKVTAAAAAEAQPTPVVSTTDDIEILRENHGNSEPIDLTEEEKAFVSTGFVVLDDNSQLAYPTWETLENAVAARAQKNQITGIDDDLADLLREDVDRAERGAQLTLASKSVFAKLRNLEVLVRAEVLTSFEFAKIVEEIFVKTKGNHPLVTATLTVLDEHVKAPRSRFTFETPQYVEAGPGEFQGAADIFRRFLGSDLSDQLRARKRDDAKLSIKLRIEGGGDIVEVVFDKSNFIDSPSAISKYRDERGKVLFVSVSRDNGMAFLSDQFPSTPTYRIPVEKSDVAIQAWQDIPSQEDALVSWSRIADEREVAQFVINGQLYGNVRQFEEASRFEGFPDLQRRFFYTVTTNSPHHEEEYRLFEAAEECAAIVLSLANEAHPLRPGFDRDEVIRAIVERVFQNPWIYARLKLLYATSPNLQLLLLPRIVWRYDSEIDEPRFSLENIMSYTSPASRGVFAEAMDRVRGFIASHVEKASQLEQMPFMRLPCPETRLRQRSFGAVGAAGTARVVFLSSTGESRPMELFASVSFPLRTLNKSKDVCWTTSGAHLANEPKTRLQLAETLALLPPVAQVDKLVSYDSMFSVFRNTSKMDTLGEYLRRREPEVAAVANGDTREDINTMGALDKGGLLRFIFEVRVSLHDEHETVVFRSARPKRFFFDHTDDNHVGALEVNAQENTQENYPKKIYFVVSRSGPDSTVYRLEHYQTTLPRAALTKHVVVRGEPEDEDVVIITKAEKAAELPLSEVPENVANAQDDEAFFADETSNSASLREKIAKEPDDAGAVSVIHVTHSQEGKIVTAPAEPQKAGQLVLKQTNSSMVSPPLRVEISDHGMVWRSKAKGFIPRAAKQLEKTIQAYFLHPSFPRPLPGPGIDLEGFLDFVASNFTHIMPRRAARVLNQVSQPKQDFIEQLNEETGRLRAVANAKIAVLEEELKQKGLSAAAMAKLKAKVDADIEKVKTKADDWVDALRKTKFGEFNKGVGKKLKQKRKRKTAAEESSESSGEEGEESGGEEEDILFDFDEGDEEEALAAHTKAEEALAGAPEYAASDFILRATHYTEDEFLPALLQYGNLYYNLMPMVRARVMQNRAFYAAILTLKERAIEMSNQVILETIASAGPGLLAPNRYLFDKEQYRLLTVDITGGKKFFVSAVDVEESKPIHINVHTTRVAIVPNVKSRNLLATVRHVNSSKITQLVGVRNSFFARNAMLRDIRDLLSPLIESEDEKKQKGAATTTTEVVEEEGEGEGEGEEEEGGAPAAAAAATKRGKPKQYKLQQVALDAVERLRTQRAAPAIDFCVVEDEKMAHGFLVAAFSDDAENATHTYDVLGIEAVDEHAAHLLLDYAEHTLLHLDVALGVGRKRTTPTHVGVAEPGFESTVTAERTNIVRRVLERRGYRRVQLRTTAIYLLDHDKIVDRVHFFAKTFYDSLYLGWIERDVVTQAEWDAGPGRRFPLVIDGRERTQVVDGRVVPIEVWREAPHPFFVPEKQFNKLHKTLVDLETNAPMTYFTVKCYLVPTVGDVSKRKLIYVSDAAPDWIALNDEVAWLPFRNKFNAFVDANPETYVTKDVITDIAKRTIETQNAAHADLNAYLSSLLSELEDIETELAEKETLEAAEADPDLLTAKADLETEIADYRQRIVDLEEVIADVQNNDKRLADARDVFVANDAPRDTHQDWEIQPEQWLAAKVSFAESRFASEAPRSIIGNVGGLAAHWAPFAEWDSKLDKLRLRYKPQLPAVLERAGAEAWLKHMLTNGTEARWRAFMNRYHAPEPFTYLSTMLVFAKDTGFSFVFEVEEQTLMGNESAPPIVLFRSNVLPVANFFSQDLPFTKRFRAGKEGRFVRNMSLSNTLPAHDDSKYTTTLYPSAQYEAKTRRANSITKLDIELDNTPETEPGQPARVVIGAFYVAAQVNTAVAPHEIKLGDGRVTAAKIEARRLNAQAIANENFALGELDTAVSDDEEDIVVVKKEPAPAKRRIVPKDVDEDDDVDDKKKKVIDLDDMEAAFARVFGK
jgi:hypothetical protein